MRWKDSSNSEMIKTELEEDYLREDHYSPLRKRKTVWPTSLNVGQKPYIMSGIGILILVILILVLFSSGNRNQSKLQSTQLTEKIQHLEERLIRLENIGERIDKLESQQEKIEQLTVKLNQIETSGALQNKRIAAQLNELHKRIGSNGSKDTAKKPVSKPPVQEQTPQIHQVRSGETLYAISRRYGIPVDTLRRLNKLAPNADIYPGQKILLNTSKTR